MRILSKLLVLSWLFYGLAGVAHAEVVVGNIGNPAMANSHTTMSYSAKYAQKFTTGNLNLGDADLNGLVYHKFSWALQPAIGGFDPELEVFPWADYTFFEWNLLSDVEGSPGTALFFRPFVFSISEPGVASEGYSGSFVLQSNSSYWLSIRFVDADGYTGLSWYPTLPVTSGSSVYGTGSLGALMVNTGAGWEEVSGQAMIEIEAESVPEPTSLQLLGFSLGSLWILRGRRRKV
jgi:hypothetical protein